MRKRAPVWRFARVIAILLAVPALFFGAYTLYLAAGLEDVRVAEATGAVLYENSGTYVDASNLDQGYVMVRHEGSDKRLKLRLSRGDRTETYDLNNEGEYEVYPLQMGSGTYTLYVFEQVKGTSYSVIYMRELAVSLENEDIYCLYPNQYVRYTRESEAVDKALELCAGCVTDAEKLAAVRAYITENVVYDYIKAYTVSGGYLPDVDETLRTRMGICFDYAALTACMLRAQNIPTRLVIGHADNAYHAWNHVLVDGEWIRVDTTFEATGQQIKSYTGERNY